jgi:protein TonB
VRANPPPSDPGCESPPVKPKPLSAPLPEYPASARAAGLVGRARVSVTVDATGRVVDVRLVEGPGGELDEAALTAVRRWTFEPGTRCGMPESATFTVRVSFVP